jgi:fructuronate reductase
VTEKGYRLDPDSGELALTHPDILHDLHEPQSPRSTVGYLAAGLKQRMAASVPPPSIVCCDNLPGNGARLRGAVLSFAAESDQALHGWIADNVAFPATMVDRIVPATTEDDIERNAAVTGLRDEGFVKTEPFRQWVIEDTFCNDRPHWEAGGALVVPDVEPFEQAKLRLLNGPHSTIAYLGFLAGYEHVHEAMQDRGLATFIRHLMTEEIAPVTPQPPPLDHATYIKELLSRFANPSLMHRTRQIAMDGSQKLPQRLLNTIRAQLEREGPIDALCLVVAAWIRYTLGHDERGSSYEVDDPLAPRFAQISAATHDPTELAARFLAIREIFGPDLPQSPRFRSKVEDALADLLKPGAVGARIARDAP